MDEYQQYIFNPETNTKNLSYNYSNKWDFDGDGKNDSLYFIGNGGAHIYYYLCIILSIDGKQKDFNSITVDMPFAPTGNTVEDEAERAITQFQVSDFNKDGIMDIFLNFDNRFNKIPSDWKRAGIKTKIVVLSFKNGKQVVKDYKWEK